ncbi:MAG: energy-coupling factor transporter ATPase [Faecalimonas sp.]|nr:energy-coupling factor transporter ATPase [Faecalimonas sp.]
MIKTEDLIFEYEKRDDEGNVIGAHRAIDVVNLDIEPGQFIAILGHNGSGKSTLAKHMNAILSPTEGYMWVDGKDTSKEENIWDVRQSAGMVFQNPDNQIIGTVVEEDVGFGPENLGVPTEEIWERVEQSLRAVGMLDYRHSSPNKLSGGQKQRVAIAGVVAMRPKCIVLDEPTAMLDPNGRKEVLRTIAELRKREKVTVILITHYMEEVIGADRVIVMDKGRIVMDGTTKEIFSQVELLKQYRLDVPQVTLLAYELKKKGLEISDGILTVEEFVSELKKCGMPKGAARSVKMGGTLGVQKTEAVCKEQPILKLEHINYIYSPETAFERVALNDINLEIYEGEFIGIIGHTGSGKSTLIQHLNGLVKASSGALYYEGENIYTEKYDMKQLRNKVGLVFQYPEHQLFEADVLSDVCFGPKNQGLSAEACVERAKAALELVGLPEKYYDVSPFDLSGGQKRRAAIAGVLAMHPKVLVLDEPTAGLDPKGRDEILDQIAHLQKKEKLTVILVSHSMEDVAKYVDRIVVMNRGSKLFDGEPKEVFAHYQELEKVGLAAPQVTYMMNALAEAGLPVETQVTTVEEALAEILRLYLDK